LDVVVCLLGLGEPPFGIPAWASALGRQCSAMLATMVDSYLAVRQRLSLRNARLNDPLGMFCRVVYSTALSQAIAQKT